MSPIEIKSGLGILMKNRDIPAKFGTVEHSPRVLGRSGGMLPQKKLEI